MLMSTKKNTRLPSCALKKYQNHVLILAQKERTFYGKKKTKKENPILKKNVEKIRIP
nr:MAG TPA: hypothetical protein [Caudoviricetes sp.]